MQADAQELEGPIPDILSRLEEAQARDDVAEKQAKRYGHWFLGLLIFGLIGWMPLAVVGAALDTTAPILLSPLCVVASVVMKILQRRAARHDLDDRRLAAGVHVLRMLAADTAASAPVKLAIDFRGYQKGGEVVAREGGFFSTVRTWKYSHPWFRLDGALLDGTRYQIAVVDTIGRKTKSKRKYTKVRESFRSQIVIKLRLRPRQGEIGPVVAALESIPPPSPLQRVSAKGEGRLLEVRLASPRTAQSKGRYRSTAADPERLVSGDMILSALLWTWDCIGRALKQTA